MTTAEDEDDEPGTCIVLRDVGTQKVPIIKLIQEITNLGIKHSMEIAETPDAVIATRPRDEAVSIASRLRQEGAIVELVAADVLPGREPTVALILTDTGPRKIEIIKLIRQASGLDLKDSKDIADAPPGLIKTGMSRRQAESFVQRISDVGGHARIDTEADTSERGE